MLDVKADLMYIYRYVCSIKFRVRRFIEFMKLFNKYNTLLNETIKKDIIKKL